LYKYIYFESLRERSCHRFLGGRQLIPERFAVLAKVPGHAGGAMMGRKVAYNDVSARAVFLYFLKASP
jgi:hypothetical protein